MLTIGTSGSPLSTVTFASGASGGLTLAASNSLAVFVRHDHNVDHRAGRREHHDQRQRHGQSNNQPQHQHGVGLDDYDRQWRRDAIGQSGHAHSGELRGHFDPWLTLTTNGSGSLTLQGTGGSTGAVGSHGVVIQNGGVLTSTAATSAGAINIIGTGANVATASTVGVFLTGNTTDIMPFAGDIHITGTSTAITGASAAWHFAKRGRKNSHHGHWQPYDDRPDRDHRRQRGGLYCWVRSAWAVVQNSFIAKMSLDPGNGNNLSITATCAITIKPNTAGKAIDLGSASDGNAPLELSLQELKRITAATLNIGDTTSGAISITNGLTRSMHRRRRRIGC